MSGDSHNPSQRANLAQPDAAQWSPRQIELLSHLRAVVVLAGSVRPTRLRRATGRFVLDLPVDRGRTVLDCWRDQITALTGYFGLKQLTVRVMIDHATPRPTPADWPGGVGLRIERDPLEFRGTGGLLRDLAADYADDDLILVAQAPQLMLEPLSPIVDALAETAGDVRLLADGEGTPGGLMLVRCGALRQIPSIGFMDLKEQALPTIASEHKVMVTRWNGPMGAAIRTRSGYLDALRKYHRLLRGQALEEDALYEDWQPTFSVVENGAVVDSSAIVHDAVILRDAVVEYDSVIVRSVVGSGGIVPAGESVVDRLVMPVGDQSPQR